MVFAAAAVRGRRRLAAVAAVSEFVAFGFGYNPAIRVEAVPK
jgi:hypothetical protein